jgi:hypothetical protein
MSPEQERVLYEVLEHSVETKTMVAGLGVRLSDHESADDLAHERIGKVEKTLTRLFAYYAAACVVFPVALWLLGFLQGAAAQ